MFYEFIRYAIAGAISFWLGIVVATWYIGRDNNVKTKSNA